MKKYAEYKDSGIALVPRIPYTWEVKPLKFIADCNVRVLPEKTDEEAEITYIDIGSVNYGQGICNTQEFTFANAPSRARRIVKTGDTIISTVRTYLKAIAYIDDEYNYNICSTGFAVYTPKSGVNRRFFFYALNADWFVSDVERYSVGISYPAITSTALSALKTILPPISEQERIVDYLDCRTAQIDTLLADLQSQVEMLDWYKRELIAETVTKGLDKSVAMKESGVSWIGEIPAHWEVVKGKGIFKKLSRPLLPEYQTVTCFRDGEVTLRANRKTDGFTESLKEIGYQGVLEGDLVIHEMDAFAGAIGISDSDGKCTPVYSVCEIINGGSALYNSYLLRQMARSGFILSLAKGIRERTVDFRFKTLVSLFYPQPPIEEQRQIAAYLDKKTAQIESLIANITAQIEKIKQYRQIVIHDAVTGKIKVTEG